MIVMTRSADVRLAAVCTRLEFKAFIPAVMGILLRPELDLQRVSRIRARDLKCVHATRRPDEGRRGYI
jgi:hypothetical protein